MAAMIALDTHVVVWLHAGETKLLPETARIRLEREPGIICPLVTLELEYLYEIERIAYPADTIVGDLEADLGLEMCSKPFAPTLREALKVKWTRDPFDRMITAHALAHDHDLLTKDKEIREHCQKAFWD
ncbi:MAG TPA: PIN domain-containing protein [Opitutales bacterium]|nr:PIN domain-containing protein [Opitutales bacterium]